MVSWVSSFSGAKTPLIGDLSSFSLEKTLGVKYQFLLINTNIHVCQQTPNTRQFHSVGGKRCRKPYDIAPSIFSVDGPFIQRTYFRIPPQKYVYIYIYIHTIYSIYIYVIHHLRQKIDQYHGFFPANSRRKHELSMKDKQVIAWVLRHPLPAGSPEWNVLPCDVLHGESLGASWMGGWRWGNSGEGFILHILRLIKQISMMI